MKPFEIRLAKDQNRNARHLENLRSFADDQSRFMHLSPEEQSLIALQIEFMAQLDNVLVARMKLHNIPV